MNRVNIKPLSANSAWKGQRYATPAYAQYKRDMGFLLPKNVVIPEPPYQIHFVFGLSSPLADGDNCIKQAQDCIAKKYGFNDKLIRKWIVETQIVPKGKEYIEFEITHITPYVGGSVKEAFAEMAKICAPYNFNDIVD